MRWIVVGAGSAGCVVTRRLVDAGHEVTLVECGPPLSPGRVPEAIDGPDALRALAEPGRTHQGLVAQRSRGSAPSVYWRGRGVGGSSAVHGMVARWGSEAQQREWGWNDIAEFRSRVLLPSERPRDDEVGRLDRLLIASSPSAHVRELTRLGRRRVTSAEAYLWPILGRFRSVTDAVVDRVRLDESGAAVGVSFADGTRVDADRVALCAGAIHTPAILLRSGVDEGVGVGLADHPAAGLVLKLRDASGHGGLITAATLEDGPVQLTPLNHLGPDADADLAMLSVALLSPQGASGTVQLDGDDPNRHPVVDLDLLSDARDLVALANAMEDAIELIANGPIGAASAAVFIDDHGTSIDTLRDRSALESWLFAAASGYVHASSSCAQALAANGALRGHENLTVADASAFSTIPDANLHLPTTVLAERFVAAWIDHD